MCAHTHTKTLMSVCVYVFALGLRHQSRKTCIMTFKTSGFIFPLHLLTQTHNWWQRIVTCVVIDNTPFTVPCGTFQPILPVSSQNFLRVCECVCVCLLVPFVCVYGVEVESCMTNGQLTPTPLDGSLVDAAVTRAQTKNVLSCCGNFQPCPKQSRQRARGCLFASLWCAVEGRESNSCYCDPQEKLNRAIRWLWFHPYPVVVLSR